MGGEIDQPIKSGKRDEMVRLAYDLFYKNGFHATGVDAILAGTGISKRTLYKHFESKEGLILATIDHYHHTMYNAILDYLEKSGSSDPVEKVLQIFDFLSLQVDNGRLYGCFVMNAKNEYTNKAKEIEVACESYIVALQELIEQGLKDGSVAEYQSLATQVLMLFEGAVIRSKGTGSSHPVKLAKKAAEHIVRL